VEFTFLEITAGAGTQKSLLQFLNQDVWLMDFAYYMVLQSEHHVMESGFFQKFCSD